MTPPLREKDPSSVEPYGFDWTAYLAGLGSSVTIAASTWTVQGNDAALTVSNPSVVTGGKKTQMYLSGGTVGLRYTVTNRIHTTGTPAVVADRSLYVLIRNQ